MCASRGLRGRLSYEYNRQNIPGNVPFAVPIIDSADIFLRHASIIRDIKKPLNGLRKRGFCLLVRDSIGTLSLFGVFVH